MAATVGIIANPISGRDVRRVAARGNVSTSQDKRNQVSRAVVGAAAAGAERILVMAEPFKISTGAIADLDIGADLVALDIGAQLDASDTVRATEAMRDEGAAVLIVLGGDGTNRVITKTWSDAVLVPMSTGTNNVFPSFVEPTLAGMAAGLVAKGALTVEEAAPRAKAVHVAIDGAAPDLALIDVTALVNDHVGNRLPVDPKRLMCVVLARAEPGAVGTSPIGGLLEPCGASDDDAVLVECGDGGEALLVPVSPGLFREVPVRSVRRVGLGEPVVIDRPCVLAFDGDREVRIREGESAIVDVRRDGPHVLDIDRAMRIAAERRLFVGANGWHDARGDLDY